MAMQTLVTMQTLKEVITYECPDCGGTGEVIQDWHAYNQLGMPVGFSEKAAERQRQYRKQAYGPCSRCKGKGFILKPKS